jgi:hypothetical protein
MVAILSKSLSKDNINTEAPKTSKYPSPKFSKFQHSTNSHTSWWIKDNHTIWCHLSRIWVINPSLSKVIIINMTQSNNSSTLCHNRINSSNSMTICNSLQQVLHNTNKWDTRIMRVLNRDLIMVEIAFNREAQTKEAAPQLVKTWVYLEMHCQMNKYSTISEKKISESYWFSLTLGIRIGSH